MLSTAFLLSVYVVLVAAEHPECIRVGTEKNVTENFVLAHKLGCCVFAL